MGLGGVWRSTDRQMPDEQVGVTVVAPLMASRPDSGTSMSRPQRASATMALAEVVRGPLHLARAGGLPTHFEDTDMSEETSIRWFVIFIKPDAEEDRGAVSAGFPDLDFWHENGESAKQEAKRVLDQLRQQGDIRTWKAVGHPDPFEVAKGNHPVDQWILTSEDVLDESRA